ncbi:DUF1223-domain-containing protein [Lophium mytilinum]|uniref:DUF1223-domain-containing protein n=1 Tax=Lophium mytilinum TaxID=390894 RepID=A0A6A6QVN7_9PEZI|nr:DUF1223-domain-containing protein [Lophium mytilinum]
MASIFRKIFRKKKNPPLKCEISLDGQPSLMESDPHHQHTAACFIDFAPLSVLELFQSQGCASCPPALPKIQAAAAKDPNLLLLTYDVTYFNSSTGWNDTFASNQWDARQKAYVKKWGRAGLFTPQVVADGIADGTGAEEGDVYGIVEAARGTKLAMEWHITLDVSEQGLRIDTDLQEAEVHDVLMIRYEPKLQTVKPGKGPNKGKKIKHVNQVAQVMKVGEWRGGNLDVVLPEMVGDGLETVAVVQQGPGGPIVVAQKI